MNTVEKNFDPLKVAASFMQLNTAWMDDPPELMNRVTQLNSDVQEAGLEFFKQFLSRNTSNKESYNDELAAFMDFVNSFSTSARKYHLIFRHWLKDIVDRAPGLEEKERQRAMFWIEQLIHTFSPANFFCTNPQAVKRFIDSEGKSLKNGFDNWFNDFFNGELLVQLAEDNAFEIGKNIASTPGKVVYKNSLMELIQYTANTEKVYKTPIVLVQPWINKYYIFDLNSRNSFVQFLVNQGFTVFITSWKNPTAKMRGTSFENYMMDGAYSAIRIAKDICAVDHVHVAGYCIGGTVLGTLMAWLNSKFDKNELPIRDWTLFTTLLDFSEQGDLSFFIEKESIDAIKHLVEQDGYLDKKYISWVFRLLNPENLIWRYHVNNYLNGEAPPKSEILFWNADSTRLSESMFLSYLDDFYINNKLIKEDGIKIAGEKIDLKKISQPLYAVGAYKDHICPWIGTFKSCLSINADIRYVLSADGHIMSIVNPPSTVSRKKYWAGVLTKADPPETWKEQQAEQKGSWWTDWVAWLIKSDNEQITSRAIGSENYPPLYDAPGEYAKEK